MHAVLWILGIWTGASILFGAAWALSRRTWSVMSDDEWAAYEQLRIDDDDEVER